MTCYHPITMYRVRNGKNPVTGAWPLTTSPKLGYTDKPVQVPCGQCIGCRLEYARQWTDRCEKELMHPYLPLIPELEKVQAGAKVQQLEYRKESCFLTLTYDNEHLPDDKGLNKSDLQKFWKRFRKAHPLVRIRYLACGEYGDQLGRPHYHAIVFGYSFNGVEPWCKNELGQYTYVCKELSELWPLGLATVTNDVSRELIGYVARYVVKKVNGDMSIAHYTDPETGVIRQKEFLVMSRRPGIGETWIRENAAEVVAHGNTILSNGHLAPLPRYFENKVLQIADETTTKELLTNKERRAIMARKKVEDNTPDRLGDREEIKLRRASLLSRKLDSALA